jgi:hypothetical protein
MSQATGRIPSLNVLNVHERALPAAERQVAQLLDGLSSPTDALLEDLLARAQATFGEEPEVHAWSRWLRLLRWIRSGAMRRRRG